MFYVQDGLERDANEKHKLKFHQPCLERQEVF